MTKEIAKRIVRGITDKIEATTDIDDWAEFWGFTRDDYEEFLEMAIKALEQEPCGDVISRQAVLNALEKAQYSRDFCKEHHIDYSISMEMVRIMLHDLPSVAPKQSFEGMTNGEVIQALFPKIKVKPFTGMKNLVHVIFDETEDNAFEKDWWDAPYKGGAQNE